MKVLFSVLPCMILVLLPASTAAQESSIDYMKNIEQKRSSPVKAAGEDDLGWNFYFPDKSKMAEPAKEPTSVVPATPVPASPPSPQPLSVEWFAKNYETIKNRAINNPSRENVRAELYAQRVMMDKSEVYARKRQYMQSADPYLQEGDRLPLFGTTSLAMIYNQRDLKQQALEEMYSQSGLMVFYDDNCEYCRSSITMINYMANRFPDLDIRVYAKNTPQPDVVQGLLSKIKVYPDDLIKVSEQLNITNWPSYVLVTPDNNFSLIARGMVNQTSLDDRTLIAGFENGVLGKEWYDRIHHTEMGLIASKR